MPANVEVKAIHRNRERVEIAVAKLSDKGPEWIEQEDYFFPCEGARLKLRVLAPNRGELIRYEREDRAEARCSRYLIAHTSDPTVLAEILSRAMGQIGVVKKKRTLYLVGQTRVHLDQVERLGDFLELEVVLRPNQSEAEGKQVADSLLAHLSIARQDIMAEAYIDMLARSAG